MEIEDIQKKVFEITADTMCIDVESLSLATGFVTDLNADSLDAVEIVMGIEDVFDISIPDEEADDIMTINNVIEVVMKKLAEKGMER